MSALFFALSQEAKPWIDALHLLPEKRQGHFRFYHNEKHTAVISGPGKLSMAMAVTELAQKIPKHKRHPGYRIWNLGICGSANKEYKTGEFFWIHKIHDFAQKRDYFPDQIEKIGKFPQTHLTTFDRPISKETNVDPHFFHTLSSNELSKLELVDMEASGFFEAASVYFELHQIQVGKVISDHLEGILCSASQVTDWMEDLQKKLADDFCSEGKSSQAEILTSKEWEQWIQVGRDLHFTESMLAELKKSISYFKLRNPNSNIPTPSFEVKDRTFEKKDAKAAFSTWRKILHA